MKTRSDADVISNLSLFCECLSWGALAVISSERVHHEARSEAA